MITLGSFVIVALFFHHPTIKDQTYAFKKELGLNFFFGFTLILIVFRAINLDLSVYIHSLAPKHVSEQFGSFERYDFLYSIESKIYSISIVSIVIFLILIRNQFIFPYGKMMFHLSISNAVIDFFPKTLTLANIVYGRMRNHLHLHLHQMKMADIFIALWIDLNNSKEKTINDDLTTIIELIFFFYFGFRLGEKKIQR